MSSLFYLPSQILPFSGPTWSEFLWGLLVAEIVFLFVFYLVIFPYANRRTPPREFRDYGRDRHLLLRDVLDRMKRTWCRNGQEFAPLFKQFLRTYYMNDKNLAAADAKERESTLWMEDEKKQEDEDLEPEILLKDDVDDFMAWGFFSKKIAELEKWERNELKRIYKVMKRDYGITFKPGRTPGIKACLMNVDEVQSLWRPLTVYLILLAMNIIGKLILSYSGFQFRITSTGLQYWYRPATTRPSGSTAEPLPLLFFHGIAPGGLAVYLPMLLFGLCSDGRAAFFFENPAISCALAFRALSEDQTAQGVNEALVKHLGPNHPPVIVAGHSFGSCQMTWVVHALTNSATRIRQLLLLDPVSILLCYPDTMQNFLYKREIKLQNISEAKIHLLASTEVYIEHYLRRQVAWYNSELFLDKVPDSIQVTVCLSGEDNIVNASAVKQEVDITNEIRFQELQTQATQETKDDEKKKRPVDLVYWPEHGHGMCLFVTQSWKDIWNSMVKQDFLYHKEMQVQRCR